MAEELEGRIPASELVISITKTELSPLSQTCDMSTFVAARHWDPRTGRVMIRHDISAPKEPRESIDSEAGSVDVSVTSVSTQTRNPHRSMP